MQPPYQPNTVNQTVDYGGFTWKGQPGGGWTKQTATGGAPVSSGDPVVDAENVAKFAQAQQIAANQPAIATMQAQGTTLADQYKTLLADVTGQGQQAFNTATSGENAYLGQRGLLSQQGLGNTLMSQAQSSVNAQNATNEQQVTTAGALTQSQIAQQVAALQAGNLPQAETFAGNLANTQAGITNTNTQYNEAMQQAQLEAAKPFGVTAGLVFNPSTGGFKQAGGGDPAAGYGGGDDLMALAKKILERKAMVSKRAPAQTISQFVHPA